MQIEVTLIGAIAWLFAITETFGTSFTVPAAKCDLDLNSTDKGLLTAVTFLGIFASYFWGNFSMKIFCCRNYGFIEFMGIYKRCKRQKNGTFVGHWIIIHYLDDVCVYFKFLDIPPFSISGRILVSF